MNADKNAVLFRYPRELDERIKVIGELLKKDPEFRHVRVNRTAVLLIAVYEGLEVLERSYFKS